jgi:hypothetical protein
VVFQNGVGQLVWTTADGTGALEDFLTVPGAVIAAPSGWTPDGKGLLFSFGTATEIRNGLLSMQQHDGTARSWRTVLDRRGKASAPRVSPTAKWVAYQSFDSGKYEIYVERFPEFADRRTVSGSDGGFNPVWSADGQEVFYRRLGDGAMMAVRMRTGPAFSVDAPQKLFSTLSYYPATTPDPGRGATRTWDLSPDGRFLMIKTSTASPLLGSQPDSFVHVQNWSGELQRVVRSN